MWLVIIVTWTWMAEGLEGDGREQTGWPVEWMMGYWPQELVCTLGARKTGLTNGTMKITGKPNTKCQEIRVRSILTGIVCKFQHCSVAPHQTWLRCTHWKWQSQHVSFWFSPTIESASCANVSSVLSRDLHMKICWCYPLQHFTLPYCQCERTDRMP